MGLEAKRVETRTLEVLAGKEWTEVEEPGKEKVESMVGGGGVEAS